MRYAGFPAGLAALLPCCAMPAQESPSLYAHADFISPWAVSVAFAPSGRLLAIGGTRGEVALIDIEARRVIREVRVAREVQALAFSGSGAEVFALTQDFLYSIDLFSGIVRAARGMRGAGGLLDVAGSAVVTGANNGAIAVWTTGLSPSGVFSASDLYKKKLHVVLAGRGGNEFLASSDDGGVAMWSKSSPEPVRVLNLTRQSVLAGGRDAEGELLVLGIKALALHRERLPGNPIGAVATFSLRAIDWNSGRTLKEIEIDDQDITSVAVSPNRNLAIIGTLAGIRVIDLGGGREVSRTPTISRPEQVAISANGEWVAAALSSGTVQTWRASGFSSRGQIARAVEGESVLPGSKYLVTPRADAVIPPSEHSSLAVLDLGNLGVDATVAQSVGSVLAGRLAASDRVQLVERSAIEQVMKELRLQNTGVTSAAAAAQLGQLLNAERVLLGSVNALGATIIISVRIVRTETARVEAARDVTCNSCRLEDIPRAISLLVESIVGSSGR